MDKERRGQMKPEKPRAAAMPTNHDESRESLLDMETKGRTFGIMTKTVVWDRKGLEVVAVCLEFLKHPSLCGLHVQYQADTLISPVKWSLLL